MLIHLIFVFFAFTLSEMTDIVSFWKISVLTHPKEGEGFSSLEGFQKPTSFKAAAMNWNFHRASGIA